MGRSLLITLLILGFVAPCRASDRLVVHEWGTFTSLQDEQGISLGRINTDDEPVPAFVHQMANTLLFPPTWAFTSDAKGTPAGDPNVTMRLETPVLYFHVPQNQTGPVTLSVNFAFRGGWLTQYFPDARTSIDGIKVADAMPPLTAKTVGRLSWHALILNSAQGVLPQTDDQVWTAPRLVNSAPISAGNEREHFLFYRGVGHVDAPLRVVRDESGQTLQVHAAAEGLTIGQIWLVDIRTDQSIAFRAAPEVGPAADTMIPAQFAPGDYSRGNLAILRAALHGALVANGLFADEADALLNTWERSYFHNPGERLFFMVPQTWTEAVLPLDLSVPADLTRVMVARIELVTPAQRTLLRRMSQTSLPNPKDLKEVTAAMTKLRNDPTKTAAYNALAGGRGNLEDLGVPVPPIYADFLALGRFRTALVLNFKDESGTLRALASALAP
jgi:hypothetical protein